MKIVRYTLLIILFLLLAFIFYEANTSKSWVQLLIWNTIGLILLAKSLTIVDQVRYGVTDIFERRTGLVLDEGLNFILPFIEEVTPVNYELKPHNLTDVKVFSSDRLEINIKGPVQWKPGKQSLPFTFMEVSEDSIDKGLRGSLISEIGKVAGKKVGDKFIDSRDEIERLINCILRLKRPPHFYVNRNEVAKNFYMDNSFKSWLEQVDKSLSDENCEKIFGYGKEKFFKKIWTYPIKTKKGWQFKHFDELTETEQEKFKEEGLIKESNGILEPTEIWQFVPNKDDSKTIEVLEFYKDNATRIQLILKLEEYLDWEISEIEGLYGIDIKSFKLSEIDFSEETKKAQEAERQAAFKMKAAEEFKKKKLSLMEEYILAGLTPQEANIASDVTMGAAERQAISLEGSEGAITVVNVEKKTGKE